GGGWPPLLKQQEGASTPPRPRPSPGEESKRKVAGDRRLYVLFGKPGHGLSLSRLPLCFFYVYGAKENKESITVRQLIKKQADPLMGRAYLNVRATGGAAEPLANDWRGAGEWFEIPSYGKKGLRDDEKLQPWLQKDAGAALQKDPQENLREWWRWKVDSGKKIIKK
ncbi:MAG: hypothetical protein IK113_08910, partial [Bacteroidales bacterium]|nr:hypothetical protein [Bacteroidales bacterium]